VWRRTAPAAGSPPATSGTIPHLAAGRAARSAAAQRFVPAGYRAHPVRTERLHRQRKGRGVFGGVGIDNVFLSGSSTVDENIREIGIK
jgi:hypothetical protein